MEARGKLLAQHEFDHDGLESSPKPIELVGCEQRANDLIESRFSGSVVAARLHRFGA
jgi:hypothetical protein